MTNCNVNIGVVNYFRYVTPNILKLVELECCTIPNQSLILTNFRSNLEKEYFRCCKLSVKLSTKTENLISYLMYDEGFPYLGKNLSLIKDFSEIVQNRLQILCS